MFHNIWQEHVGFWNDVACGVHKKEFCICCFALACVGLCISCHLFLQVFRRFKCLLILDGNMCGDPAWRWNYSFLKKKIKYWIEIFSLQ